jgi:hypothetical protein
MTSLRGYDIGSARLMLAYLGRATKSYQERQDARQKLRIELSRLKKISTKSMKGAIRKLEHSIGNAIRKEQHILKHQRHEDVLHGGINERIKELEENLARYLAIHEARAQRVKLLEDSLTTERLNKKEQLAIIKRSLSRAERIYKNAKKSKKQREQLSLIKEQIDSLRAKVKEIEKKH